MKRQKEPHPTVPLVIKHAEVDALMAPVVTWLNSYPEVTTLFCCQGDVGEGGERPYVLFTCTCPRQLAAVLECLGTAAEVRVCWSREYPCFRYHAAFGSQTALASWSPPGRRFQEAPHE